MPDSTVARSFTRNQGYAWWTLRAVFGGMAIASGLDKFLNLLTDWSRYLWPTVPEVLNVAPDTFMVLVGVVEVLVGIGIFTAATRIFAYILSLWLLAISLNLVLTGFLDIAARDVGLAGGGLLTRPAVADAGATGKGAPRRRLRVA